ncbi:MAG TPA: toprim domain-containing protein, partial [Vicinamibacteria bacterium]
ARAGVEVETRPSDEDRSENEALYQANAFAARFYYDTLVKSGGGERARRYLEGRGIPREAWTHFGLGFAPGGGEALWEAAQSKGVPRDLLLKLRLVVPREGGRGAFDYFRDRVIFPIVQPGSRVVGFGARTMGEAEPKYLNSAESTIFQKRRTFYGLDRAHEAIRAARHALIVEGYTDLIRLHLCGLTHTLATCGTALTPDHARRVRRLTRRVVLVPDGDAAGENAATVSGALLMGEGVEVGVATLPPGQDPDSAAKAMSPQEFQEVVGRPLDYFPYLDYTIQRRSPSAREREEMIRRVVGAIGQSDDPLRVDVLLGELARVVGVDVGGLRQLLRPGGGATRPSSSRREVRMSASRLNLERLVLRLVLEGTPGALEALEALDVEEFSDEANRKFYKLLDSAREAHIDLRGRDFQRRAEENGLEGFAAEISLVSVPPGNVDTLLKDTVRKLKKLRIDDELALLRERQLNLPPDSDEAVAVGAYIQRLQQAKAEL